MSSPLTAAEQEAEAKLAALAAKCGPTPSGMLSRRRGTKPASLPQRLAEAAHAIKEP